MCGRVGVQRYAASPKFVPDGSTWSRLVFSCVGEREESELFMRLAALCAWESGCGVRRLEVTHGVAREFAVGLLPSFPGVMPSPGLGSVSLHLTVMTTEWMGDLALP